MYHEISSCHFILWTLQRLIDWTQEKRMGYEELIRFYLTYFV